MEKTVLLRLQKSLNPGSPPAVQNEPSDRVNTAGERHAKQMVLPVPTGQGTEASQDSRAGSSPVQVAFLNSSFKNRPPLYIVCEGRVFQPSLGQSEPGG